MAPTLYGTLISPPFRAVLFTEAALGIKLEHQEVDLTVEDQFKPEYVKLNPQHTIPLLVDDDGTTVSDSHAIMAYLVGKYGKDDKLYPKDHARRADIDHKLHFDSGCMFSLLRRIVYHIKLNGAEGPDDACKKLADDNYGFLNAFLEGRTWVSGDSITIADFSLLNTIASLNLFVPVDPKFTNVVEWMKRAEALPYYNLIQQGLAKSGEFIKMLRS